MSKILYVLWVFPLVWTALSFAGIPVWMFMRRRERAYQRATNWRDDFISYSTLHPHVERADLAGVSHPSCQVGAIHQVQA